MCSSEALVSKNQCPSEWPSLSVPGSGAPARVGKKGNHQNKERSRVRLRGVTARTNAVNIKNDIDSGLLSLPRRVDAYQP